MSDGPRYSPGTPVRVAHEVSTRANLALFELPEHDHYGDVGRVVEVQEGPSGTRYEVRFDEYGDDRVVFDEDELEPAPPRKT